MPEGDARGDDADGAASERGSGGDGPAEDVTPGSAFEGPPRSFTDAAGREIVLRTGERAAGEIDPGAVADGEGERPALGDLGTALWAMYDTYEVDERVQGLPPLRAPDRRRWVADLLENGLNVVALHGDRAVGHACLLPYDDTAELVIFVHPAYQQAGIGSRLIRALLALGDGAGVGHVWLSVQRDNHVAMNLYRSVGFETTDRDRIEHEMERVL